MNIFSVYMFTCPVNIHLRTYTVISTAQTDLGLRSRSFSLTINKLPTFSEISEAGQRLKVVFTY